VILSGVRGSAWNSVVKDILILTVVLVLGIYLPIHLYGGIGPMFHAIDAAKPGFLTFPAKGSSVSWFQSTVLLTALGFFMWPHTFGSVYTAKDERIFRRNAIILPVYQLILLFVFFVGFAATLKVPGLKGGDIDLSLFRLSIQSFDPWVVGVIGAAGVLTALVPGSMILTSASTLIANDVYRGAINRRASDALVGRMARWLVPVVALIAIGFTLHGGDTIVALLLMGYSFVTQLFPALIASLMKRRRATKQGAMCGIVAGVAVVVVTTVMHLTIGQMFPFLPDALKDVNIGFLALALNIVVLVVVSALTQPRAATGDSREAGGALR
jgi:SSS family solute:Na+ symporter